MKNNIYFIFIALLFNTSVNSQPYYYTSNYELVDSIFDNYSSTIYRINMSNPAVVETLMTNIEWIALPVSDEYGNWLAYEEYFRLFIMNVNNPGHNNVIANRSEGIVKLSYADAVDKLMILFDDNSPDIYNMVMVDPYSLTITDTIPYDVRWESSREEDIVFSQTGDVMYLMKTDTILQKGYIASYSLSSKQIIDTKYIEELSSPSSDEFYFEFRRNGFGVVESWKRLPVSTSYYRIYFLDNDSLSITIHRDESQTWGNAYVAGNGKYLLMFKSVIPDSVNISPLTGETDIYDMIDGEIKKTIQLPPDGEVMCFENFPNNIYYVIDIEEPTRQIYTLKMDSIFNVLDLTSLNPSSAIVNSPPFTLTVNGNGFDTLSTVYFNDTAKTTTYISDSVLTAEISTSDISVVGNYPVWVTDQWGTSDTSIFTAEPPPPVLTAISPGIISRYPSTGLPPIGLYVTVTLSGNYFSDSSVVYYNGSAKTTTFVSDSTLTFQLSGQEISSTGNFPVWVSNYSVNSDTLILPITNTLPQSITPTLQCVTNNGGSFTAYFGYVNNNSVDVYIPIADKNKFTPVPQDRGQTKLFLPGTHTNVFSVNFDGRDLTWTLDQTSVTANRGSTPCP